MLNRREFIAAATSTFAFLGTGCRGAASPGAPEDPWFRISLAQWSFHRHLFGRAKPAMSHLEFITEAGRMGFRGVEFVNAFFKDKARDAKTLREMNRRAEDADVENLLIMCDGEGRLGDPDDAARKQAVDNHRRWLAAAADLGCHSIRVNAASEGGRSEQARLAADGLRQLSELGEEHGLNVLVENHGGLSSNGAWLAEVMRRVDHPRCGTLPDFGNFRIGKDEEYDRYEGVAELMPFAKAVSAKSHDFEEDGSESHTDFARMLEIVHAAGYRGWIGVEYEGGELSEHEGIQSTKLLLERLRVG